MAVDFARIMKVRGLPDRFEIHHFGFQPPDRQRVPFVQGNADGHEGDEPQRRQGAQKHERIEPFVRGPDQPPVFPEKPEQPDDRDASQGDRAGWTKAEQRNPEQQNRQSAGAHSKTHRPPAQPSTGARRPNQPEDRFAQTDEDEGIKRGKKQCHLSARL